MGASTANISRRLYDERKRYVQTVLQQGVPLVDADYNEAQESFYGQIRRAVQSALGDGAPGVAFQVVERREGGALVENDLLVKGGYHPRTGPERLWVAGHGAALHEDVPWSASPEIVPRSTGMTACELHDSAAFFEPDALVGRTLVPNIANPGKRYAIVANTVNSITVGENEDLIADGARPGDPYRITLTTPAADRVDTVYVDAYLDEIDAAEDPELLHTFSTKLEAMCRLRLVQSVLVAEGGDPPAPANPDDPLVDADGNEHFLLPIARIRREANNPRIENRMIEDLRRQIFSLDQVEDRYVNADGDTMRGDLAFLPGTAIHGEGVVGEQEIQDDSVSQRKLQRRTHLLGDDGVIPTAERLPVVHDNRYFPKSVLATFFGPNMVVNGDFEKGLTGWIEKTPFPVHGAPGPHVLEKVRVGWRLCGPDCCRGLFTHFHPGFKGCEVCAVAQEIPVCGGGLFAWSQSVRVARGNDRVRPFLAVGLFASEQFLGQVRVPFHETLDLGNGETARVPVVLGREHGLRRLRALFDLDACVDRIIVALCFEVDFDGCSVDELLEVIVCDVRGWRFADEGAIEDGIYTPPLPPPFVPGDPGIPVPVPDDPSVLTGGGDGETPITESKTTKVPVIDRVTTTGEVIYRPAHRQTWLNVYRTLDPVTSLVWDPENGQVRSPELVEVVPTRSPEIVTTHVGEEPGPPPPWIFTVDPLTWVLGEPTHVVVTGKDFSPDLTVAVVPGTGLAIQNVTVSPEGEQVEFDVVFDGATAGTAALVLTNPDGQEAQITISIEEPVQPPVPTTIDLAAPALEVTAGQEAPFTLVVRDQDGQSMPGVEIAAETSDPALATVTPEVTTTDAAGQAAFTIAGVAEGNTTITFVAGDAQAMLAVAVAAEPVPVVGSIIPSAEGVNLGSAGTTALTVQVLDEAGQPLEGQTVVAASTEPAIVAVTPAELATGPDGKATFTLEAVGPGSAGVTFNAGGLMLTVPVSVALPPPLIEAVSPADVFPGTTQLLEVFGAGFQAGLTLAVSPATGITLGTPAVMNGGTLIQVEAQIAPDIAPGPVALTVTNPDGQSATLTGAFRIAEATAPGPGDPGFPTLDVEFHDETPGSLRVLVDPNADPVTILQGMLGAAEGLPPGEKTVSALNLDGTPGNLRFVVAGELGTPVDLAVGLLDAAGRVATVQVGTLQPSDVVLSDPLTSDTLLRELVTLGASVGLPAGTFVPVEIPLEAAVAPTGFDMAVVTGLRLTLTPHPAPEGTQSTLWFDSFALVRTDATVEVLEDFASYPDQAALDVYWKDIGARHVLQVESAISRELVPVIVAPADRVFDLKFHGDPGWAEADVVLVKATEASRAAGVLDEERGIRFGDGHYRTAPIEGCRNVFIEPAYIASALCRAVVARAQPFEFVAGDCECAPEFPQVQRIGDFVSDPLLHRILPDDGFRGTPTGYGEMFALEYCDPANPETWVRIGSRSTPAQVLHAGGGRNDPEVPPGLPKNPQTGEPIYVTLYHGPGSPQGARESLIAVDVPVPAGTAEADIIVSPVDATGFAVGMPVWLRNDCHPGHPRCRISSCEVETSPHDPSVYGLYGEVVAIEPNDNRVRVRFFEPPQVAAEFQTELKAALLVSPRDAMGYYWEASPGLVDLVSTTDGICIRWWFRYWEAAASRCTLHGPFEEAGVLLCDGDGHTRNFPFVGETGAVIDPAEWRTIWSKPIEPCRLWNDLAPGGNTLEVCTPQRFSRGDVVRVVDDRWPTGWRATVVAVDTVNNRLRLAEPLPATLPGLPDFDGFKVARNAVAFRVVVRANIMKSPTTRAALDGTPLFGPDFVVVDFDAGRFTFDPSFAGPVRIFYGAEWRTYRLPPVHGIYKLQAVNFAGVPGWYSDLIRVGPLLPLGGIL